MENEDCESVYNRETGKNGFIGGGRHAQDLIARNDSSVLRQHCVENGGKILWYQTIEDRVRGDQMKRQILESIRISQVPEENTMNRKDEWNSARLPRATISRS